MFYFTGPTTLGPTTIDILTQYDEFVFTNACDVQVTVEPLVDDLSGVGDLETYTGNWLVEVNAEQTEAEICKNDPQTNVLGECFTITLPACGE